MTQEEQEKIDKLVEEREKAKEQEKENSKTMALTTQNENTALPTTELEMPNYIPQIDKTKELEDQAGDVVKLMGAQKASQNESFMSKVAENFANKVLTEQETTQMKKERLLAEQYYLKWQAVLKLVHMPEAQGLGLMKICVAFMIVPYLLLRFIGFTFMCVSETFEFFNTLFNAVFGDGGSILLDKNGQPVIDDKTKKPYKTKTGYNLFAKILLGFIISAVLLALIFVFVKVFTGFDIFEWFRTLTL